MNKSLEDQMTEHERLHALSAEEKRNLPLDVKNRYNIWDHINDFANVYQQMCIGEWQWYKNSDCKYVELRIDMRDGGCIIKDGHGNRINPSDLEFQYGEDAK